MRKCAHTRYTHCHAHTHTHMLSLSRTHTDTHNWRKSPAAVASCATSAAASAENRQSRVKTEAKMRRQKNAEKDVQGSSSSNSNRQDAIDGHVGPHDHHRHHHHHRDDHRHSHLHCHCRHHHHVEDVENSATNLYSNSAFSWHWRKIILLLPDWMTFTTSSRIQINPNAVLRRLLLLPFWWPAFSFPILTYSLTHTQTHTQTHTVDYWEAFSIRIKFRWLPPFAQGTMRVLHILIHSLLTPSRIRQVPQRLMSCSVSCPLFERCRCLLWLQEVSFGSESRMCIAIAIGRQQTFNLMSNNSQSLNLIFMAHLPQI